MAPNEITEERLDELKAAVEKLEAELNQTREDLELCKKILRTHERL